MEPNKVDRVKNKKNYEVKPDKKEIIDITDLAEECILKGSNNWSEKSLVSSLPKTPVFELTIEEEFKIHELIVRKEDLDDEIFQLFIKVASFQNFENHLMSICRGRFDQGGNWNCFEKYEPDVVHNLRKLNGIPILSSTSMFDGFSNLSDDMKSEMLEFTLPLRAIIVRAQMSENKAKAFFIQQRQAAGILTKSLQEAYNKVFPNNRYTKITKLKLLTLSILMQICGIQHRSPGGILFLYISLGNNTE